MKRWTGGMGVAALLMAPEAVAQAPAAQTPAAQAPAAQAPAAGACAAGMVCAASPQSVVEALRSLGYKAEPGKDKDGDPRVASASGYDYDIVFFGCKAGANCTSLSFLVSFEKDPTNTAALANQWNRTRRFATMAVNDDGSLMLRYDLATAGGVNPANFADVLDWWGTALAEANRFFKEHPAPAAAPAAPAPPAGR